MTGRAAKPRAGDVRILMDGKIRVLIQEVLGDMVVLSRMIEPIPITKLASVPDAGDVWILAP
jgi:hypothetical protein